jgi:arsenite-transporting ATPase
METVRSAFAPVPVLTAPWLPTEVSGPALLDELGAAVFEDSDAHAVLHGELTQELTAENGHARLRLPLPLVDRGDIELKKIGLEVVVRVGDQKRTIILPPSLAQYETSGARFADGALEVDFERAGDGSGAGQTD